MHSPGRARVRRAFGVTIRILRKRLGVSQQNLALEAKVSTRHMSAIEQGDHTASLELVYRLLSALKISWVEFGLEMDKHAKPGKNNHLQK